MIISTNLTAIVANSYLAGTEEKMQGSLKKLSSGYKINTSEDDSVGKALSEKMQLQIRGLKRAAQNAADGISVAETADGALQEVTSILQRLRELAVKGSSESYDDDDRVQIQVEADALKKEINRISTDTEFNKKSLLNGALERKAYTLDNTGKMVPGVDIVYNSNNVDAGTYKLDVKTDGSVDFIYDGSGNKLGFSNSAQISQDGNRCVVTDKDDFTMIFTLDSTKVSNMEINLELWDMGAMVIQLGANEGQTMDFCIPEMSTDTLGLTNMDLSTPDGCTKAIDSLDQALTLTLKVRGEIGAYQNRLETAVSSTETAEQSLTAALSRIIDVDMAEEMTTYTQYNVLQQAGISMLSQANQMPEKVLQLLQ